MAKENKYARTAIECVKIYQEKNSIEDLWVKHVKQNFPLSESSQTKPCPKNTFLNLCEASFVKVIPKED